MESATAEEYLEVIYKLSREEAVRPSKIASALGVAAPTVTSQLKRLEAKGLLTRPHGRVKLTGEGEARALSVVRSHRLSERFLTDVLGIPVDEAHDEACKWEHALSPRVQQALEEFLQMPDVCPHGHPIPAADGTVGTVHGHQLTDSLPGDAVRVVQVAEDDDALLSYLTSLGLLPGTVLRVVDVAPFHGPLLVEVGGSQYALGREVAAQIVVVGVSV